MDSNKQVRKIIDREKERKWCTKTLSETSDNTWKISSLSLIGAGDGYAQREGEQIKAISIFCRFMITKGDTGGNNIRVVILWINAPENVLTTAEVWDATTGPTMAQLRAQNYTGKYVVLMDEVIPVPSTCRFRNWEKMIKLNHLIDYRGTNTSDGARGSLWLMHTSDSSQATFPTINGSVRTIFIDK